MAMSHTSSQFTQSYGFYVAVLSTQGAPQAEQPAFSLWARKSRNVRPSLRPGFGAWRASTMPR